jgi:flagellar basal-body rod protein FlgB
VSLEQEMMKEGDINRSYTINTNIKRAFHQMMLSVLK